MSLLTTRDFWGSKLSENLEGDSNRRALQAKTLPGRQRARELGRLGGRPRKLSLEEIAQLKKLYDNRANKVDAICQLLNISRPSFYKYLYERHRSTGPKK